MSKESKIKKNLEKIAKEKATSELPAARQNLTPEEKAKILRDRLANRPVIMFRYPNGKLNKRFIIILTLLVVAMIAALYFLTQRG